MWLVKGIATSTCTDLSGSLHRIGERAGDEIGCKMVMSEMILGLCLFVSPYRCLLRYVWRTSDDHPWAETFGRGRGGSDIWECSALFLLGLFLCYVLVFCILWHYLVSRRKDSCGCRGACRPPVWYNILRLADFSKHHHHPSTYPPYSNRPTDSLTHSHSRRYWTKFEI